MFHARLSLVAIFDEEVVDHPQHKAELEAEEEVKAHEQLMKRHDRRKRSRKSYLLYPENYFRIRKF